jgi:glycosyltransferase involved in cell wall biosynthesis
MNIQIIIAAYNEEATIGRVVSEIKEKFENVIVVNDGSNDQTREIAKQAGAIVIDHYLNRGQGAALQTGINFALKRGADIMVTFDGDGQHQVSEIEPMTEPLLLGQADVVLGSRFLKPQSNVPALRKTILRFAALITRLYTGLRVTDTHNGFRAFSAKAANLVKIQQDGMAHASEIIEQIRKNSLRFTEVPVTVKYSNYSLKKGQRLSNSFRIVLDLILAKLSR